MKQPPNPMMEDMEAKAKVIVAGNQEALVKLVMYTMHQFGQADHAMDVQAKMAKGLKDMRAKIDTLTERTTLPDIVELNRLRGLDHQMQSWKRGVYAAMNNDQTVRHYWKCPKEYTGPERRKTIRSLADVDCRVPA